MRVISNENPPVYKRARQKFGKDVDMKKGTAFTYGGNIYSHHELSPDLLVHEMTHIRQQKEMGSDEWWDRYFDDPNFRLEQEVEAYRNQYQYFKKTLKDRNQRFNAAVDMAKSLAGPMYGNMITFSQALRKIKNGD